MVILYHGTTKENALGISRSGFSTEYSGTNWGSTFGKGVYFTNNMDEAFVYSGNNGVVLMIDVDINGFQLRKNYSPTDRNDRREIKKLITTLKNSNYNCLITKDEKEFVFFNGVSFNKYSK